MRYPAKSRLLQKEYRKFDVLSIKEGQDDCIIWIGNVHIMIVWLVIYGD